MRLTALWVCIAGSVAFGFQTASDPFQAWKNRNRIGTRYEGLVEERAGNVALDLISFVAGFPSSLPRTRTKIHVLYACLPGERVGLLARELKVLDLYRMEAPSEPRACRRTPDTYEDWTTAEVIERYNIDLKNIGLVAHLADNRFSVLPALAYVEGTPPPQADRYQVWFRADAGLSDATLSVEPDGGGGVKTFNRKASVPNREPFRIDIPFAGLPRGRYRARLTVTPRGGSGGDTSSLQFEFRHDSLLRP